MLNLLHVLRNFNTNEDGDDGSSKEDWLVTQRSALIGLLTLPLTDWEGLDQPRLIPTPAYCIKESSFRVAAPKISQNLPSCPNQQSNEKEFFHRILIIYWLSR